MGLVNFFRRFVPNFLQLDMPITDLLKSSRAFNWTENQDSV